MTTEALHNTTQLTQRVRLLESSLSHTIQYLYIVDLTGCFLYANQMAARFTGMTQEEMVGKTWQELGYPRRVGEHFEAELAKMARTGQPVTGEITLEDTRIFEYTLIPFFDDAGAVEAAAAVARDITERKRIREEQTQSLTLLNAALESAAEGTIITDRKGNILLYNQRFKDIWNLPDEWDQVPAQERFDLMLQQIEDPEAFVAYFEEVDAHPDMIRLDLIKMKDGRIFERHLQPYRVDGELCGRVCNFEDVTERIQAEENLRKREAQLQAIITNNADAMVVVDEEGILRFINPAGERLFGRPAQEILGTLFGAPIFFEEKVEIEICRPDSSTTLVEMSASPIEWEGRAALLASLRDVTARHEAQEALIWEAGVNAAIAELAKALIKMAALDEISFLILERAKQLTGSTFGYVGHIEPQTGHLICTTMTRDIWEICQVPEKSITFKEFGGLWGWVLKNRRPLMSNTIAEDPRATGTPKGHIPIERFLSVPAMVGDTLMGQIALANPDRLYTGRDLALVERLASLYALAVQRQRAEDEREQLISELDAFAHTVAHDLKNPINAIIGYAEALEEDFDGMSPTERTQYLHTIVKGSRKMDSIINALLLLSSVREAERIDITALNMAAIVAEVQERLSHLIEAQKAMVHLCENCAWPEAMGYAPWVEEVWTNYLSNALKYGSTARKAPEITLGFTCQPSDVIRFWVRDKGPGLQPEEQTRIFAPFTRLNPVETEGHGLGLSIVSRIVKRLGGQTGVESTPGLGSTFWFELPAAK